MATVKNALNRFSTEDRIIHGPIISWPPHELPQKVQTGGARKTMSTRTFSPNKRKEKKN